MDDVTIYIDELVVAGPAVEPAVLAAALVDKDPSALDPQVAEAAAGAVADRVTADSRSQAM
jgi:hypothetical protein